MSRFNWFGRNKSEFDDDLVDAEQVDTVERNRDSESDHSENDIEIVNDDMDSVPADVDTESVTDSEIEPGPEQEPEPIKPQAKKTQPRKPKQEEPAQAAPEQEPAIATVPESIPSTQVVVVQQQAIPSDVTTQPELPHEPPAALSIPESPPVNQAKTEEQQVPIAQLPVDAQPSLTDQSIAVQTTEEQPLSDQDKSEQTQVPQEPEEKKSRFKLSLRNRSKSAEIDGERDDQSVDGDGSASEDTPPEEAPTPKSLLNAAIGELISLPSALEEEQIHRASQMLEFEEFTEPDWREIIELLNKKIEPCDITGAMVDVSRKRKLWRSIENSIAQVRMSITGRLVERAKFRFRERIDQDEALNKVESTLSNWRNKQSNSIAWQFNEQVFEQLALARQMRADAVNRITKNHSYRNDKAHEIFGAFAKSTVFPIVFGMYLYSVLVLTDNRFHTFLKFLPFFNQSHLIMGIIVSGFVSLVVLAGAWRYTSKVREVQWKFVQAQRIYQDSLVLISHAYYEEVRLEQQAAQVEPLLRVLAHGYSSRWVIDDSLDIDVSTKLNIEQLPGCFGFARAVDGSDDQISKLRDLAARSVVRPGWRTEIIRKLGERHGDKLGTTLTFTDLDRDFGVSQFGARDLFLQALEDRELAKRVGREKLIETVNIVHSDVLRNTQKDLRPPVLPTRKNGFEDINTSSQWLVDEDRTENWVEFLSAILKEAPPFSYLNLSDSGLHGRVNDGTVKSFAVLPRYLMGVQHDSVMAEVIHDEVVAPIDIAVRVDVSEWGTLDSFGIFEPVIHEVQTIEPDKRAGGLRG